MARGLALTSAVIAALSTSASPAGADVRYCSPVAPSDDQAQAGHFLQACLRQDEGGHFLADVDVDLSVYSSPTVTFWGLVQSPVIADKVGWWVRLDEQAVPVVPGQDAYTVQMPHSLADFEAFTAQTGIGWTAIATCVDAVQAGTPLRNCSTYIETPSLHLVDRT